MASRPSTAPLPDVNAIRAEKHRAAEEAQRMLNEIAAAKVCSENAIEVGFLVASTWPDFYGFCRSI